MGLAVDILTILMSYSAGYKVMRRMIRGYPAPHRKSTPPNTLFATMARLRHLSLVTQEDGLWKITQTGRTYLEKRRRKMLPRHHRRTQKERAGLEKNLVIAFDIPERHRRKRDWLRAELRLLGFEPIQKSVWFGASPLPSDFIATLDDLNILPYFKFFKAKVTRIV